MKIEYYIVDFPECRTPLRKFIDDYEYFWLCNKWYNMGGRPSVWRYKPKKKITEEEAFRYILEN